MQNNCMKESTVTNIIVNINAANDRELQRLPGVGPVLAVTIIRHRRNHGYFESMEDLENVWGLGFTKLATLAKHIVFEEPASRTVTTSPGNWTSVWRTNLDTSDYVEVECMDTSAWSLQQDLVDIKDDILSLAKGVSVVKAKSTRISEALDELFNKEEPKEAHYSGELLWTSEAGFSDEFKAKPRVTYRKKSKTLIRWDEEEWQWKETKVVTHQAHIHRVPKVMGERRPSDMNNPVAIMMDGVKDRGVLQHHLSRTLSFVAEQQLWHEKYGQVYRQRDISEHKPSIVPYVMWKWMERCADWLSRRKRGMDTKDELLNLVLTHVEEPDRALLEFYFWAFEYMLACREREDYLKGMFHVASLEAIEAKAAWLKWMVLFHNEKFEASLLEGIETEGYVDAFLNPDEYEAEEDQDLCMTEDQIQDTFGAKKRHGEGYMALDEFSEMRKKEALAEAMYEYSEINRRPVYGRLEMTSEDQVDIDRLMAWWHVFGEKPSLQDRELFDMAGPTDEAMTVTEIIGTPFGKDHEGLLKIIGYEPVHSALELKIWRNEEQAAAARETAKRGFIEAAKQCTSPVQRKSLLATLSRIEEKDRAWSKRLKKAKKWWSELKIEERLEWAYAAGLITPDEIERILKNYRRLDAEAEFRNFDIPYEYYAGLWKTRKKSLDTEEEVSLPEANKRYDNRMLLKDIFATAEAEDVDVDELRRAMVAIHKAKGLSGRVFVMGINCKETSHYGQTPVCHYMTSMILGYQPQFMPGDVTALKREITNMSLPFIPPKKKEEKEEGYTPWCRCYSKLKCRCSDPARYSMNTMGVIDYTHDIKKLTVELAETQSRGELLKALGEPFAKKLKTTRKEWLRLANALKKMQKAEARMPATPANRAFPSVELA